MTGTPLRINERVLTDSYPANKLHLYRDTDSPSVCVARRRYRLRVCRAGSYGARIDEYVLNVADRRGSMISDWGGGAQLQLCPSLPFYALSFPPILPFSSFHLFPIPSSLSQSSFCFSLVLRTFLGPSSTQIGGWRALWVPPTGPRGARPTNGFWRILS